uniref:Putative lectin/glucanase superfamily protein n=1 Tax=viral metagenome TaxID=1070528 RepID=A0A6M3IQW4_9ZZZZ
MPPVAVAGLNTRRNFLLDSNLVLYLPLWDSRLKSSPIISQDIYSHSCSVNGAIWTPQGRAFDGDDDYIEVTCPQLNFTTGDFSGAIWVKFDAIGNHNYLISRGLIVTDGWYFDVETGGYLEINTSQAGVNQQTYGTAGLVTTGSWLCLGFTRSGAACRVYKNGVDITAGSGTHVNPLTSARTLKIGVDDNLTNDFDGEIGEVYIPSRALIVGEHLGYYNSTKWRYN